MTDTILLNRDGHIATITLNRPEKLNAMTKPMWLRLGEVLDELNGDETVRSIILRGAGGKSFSPGNDIGEFATERANPEQGKAYGKILHKTLGLLQDCPVPTVALIEGLCIGAGLEIAGCCDIRICGTSSRFGAPIKNLGLVMGYNELAALTSLAGRNVALEILLEGRVFDAAEAKEKHLVSRVVADADVESEAIATAKRIADGAPLTARWHKKFAKRLTDPTPLTEAEQDEGYACYGTEDFKIGCNAFLAKTKPEFKGS